MSASYVALSAELSDLEAYYPLAEIDSQAARQAAFLALVDEQFDSEYEEDLEIENIFIEGGRLVVEYQTSTELCNEITHALFEGLTEQDGSGMLALEYNDRVGIYTCMAPGYDEAEYVDECFDDFDGLMHELEDFMDRHEQLMRVIELSETEPTRSRLREYLGEDEADDEPPEDEGDDDDGIDEAYDEMAATDPDDEPDRDSLMEDLRQAMADGDEDRASELFAKVQRLSD